MNRNFKHIANTSTKIKFNPEWANGTGYYDHAVQGDHAPRITPGTWVTAYDESTNRTLIIGGGETSNIVLFERYRNNDNNTICSNTSRDIKRKYPGLDGAVEDVYVAYVMHEVNKLMHEVDEDVNVVYERVVRYMKDAGSSYEPRMPIKKHTPPSKKTVNVDTDTMSVKSEGSYNVVFLKTSPTLSDFMETKTGIAVIFVGLFATGFFLYKKIAK